MSNKGTAVYRLYNPNTGLHMFTASAGEHDGLMNAGWRDEGIAFYSPKGAGKSVYRLYDTGTGEHLLTENWIEYTMLRVLPSWRGKGTAWTAR